MNITKPIKSKELTYQTKEKGFLYSNSAIKCSQCKVIFPVEYPKCPQCEVAELWQKLNFQIKYDFGGK
jgi:uncharacterized paraquat-inducible protein A